MPLRKSANFLERLQYSSAIINKTEKKPTKGAIVFCDAQLTQEDMVDILITLSTAMMTFPLSSGDQYFPLSRFWFELSSHTSLFLASDINEFG